VKINKIVIPMAPPPEEPAFPSYPFNVPAFRP
jgi:hypothetical protein